MTYDLREALFLEMAAILDGDKSVAVWFDIRDHVLKECQAIRDERDLLNLTGEAQR